MSFAEGGISCQVKVLGPFALTGPGDIDLTPRGAKAQALIALLMMRRERKLSRAQIQDKLWSDRGPKQGSESLRQTLTEIRRALGAYRFLLQADRRFVSLAQEGLVCDLDDPSAAIADVKQIGDMPELLEGLVVLDPEFEHWIRDQRIIVADLLDEHLEALQEKKTRKPQLPTISVPQSARNIEGVQGEVFRDGVLKNLGEWSMLRIVEQPSQSIRTGDFSFECRAMPTDTDLTLHMRFSESKTGEIYWTCTRQVAIEQFDGLSEPMAQLRNHLSDRAMLGMLKGAQTPEQSELLDGFRLACRIFQHGGRDYESIMKDLSELRERQPTGLVSAWLAFLTTYELGERKAIDLGSIRETAESHVRDAIEKEPYHSMVLALCSYVRSFVFRDYFTGFELARRSVECNGSNPLAWAAMGAANFYLGRHKEAREAVLRARRISGGGPYHYLIESLCCISATLTGHLDEAEMYGNLTHQLAPTYTPPLRYLTAIHTRRGELEKAEAVTAKLRKLEPDFSLELMSDASYPVAALRDSGFFNFTYLR